MRTWYIALVACLVLSSGAARAESLSAGRAVTISGTDVSSVSTVDFTRYSGRWYELSRTPNLFEIACTCVTATYQPLSATSISLFNACNRFSPNGPLNAGGGIGQVPNPEEPGQLKVTFDDIQPVEQDYWIVDLVDDPANPAGPYAFAAVSGPQGDFIFVLSRKPVLETVQDREAYLRLLQRLNAQNLPITRLNFTPQPETCNYDAQQP